MLTPTGTQELTLEFDRNGTTTIVRCHGRLVSGVADVLYTRVSKVIPESKRIVLDLTDLTFMDSMGLGTVMRLYVSARSSGCSLEMVHIGKRIKELLQLTNIWDVFTTVGEHGIKF